MDIFDFSEVSKIDDPNEATRALLEALSTLLNENCPVKKIKMIDKDPPHVSPMIKLLLKKKSKLLKSKKFTNAEEMNSKIKHLMYQNIKDRKANSVSGTWWNLVKYYTGKQQANSPVINFFAMKLTSTSLKFRPL